jgi:hypothetical protein
MKKIFSLFILAFLVNAAVAQSTTVTAIKNDTKPSDAALAAAPSTEALMVKQSEHDFGKIPQGKPVTHIFEVFNTGTTPLKISNVTASCGCTTPEWEKDKLVPVGGSTKITVGYNAAAEGVFGKQITISYNENQAKVLTIRGEVWKTPNASAPENTGLNDLK